MTLKFPMLYLRFREWTNERKEELYLEKTDSSKAYDLPEKSTKSDSLCLQRRDSGLDVLSCKCSGLPIIHICGLM